MNGESERKSSIMKEEATKTNMDGHLDGVAVDSLTPAAPPAERKQPIQLLDGSGYRPWQGRLRPRWTSPWPVARVALRIMLRQKLLWVIYAVSLLTFFVYFGGIYLFAQIDLESLTQGRATQAQVRMWTDIKLSLQKNLKLTGDAETFRNYFWFQGYFVMACLVLAGSIVIGNDFQQGSLPFYLSKPLHRWHYLAGKCLVVALVINLFTTLPALLLFLECALLEVEYASGQGRVFVGILGYGLTLTIPLSLLIVALASWLRKTAALAMVWVGLLFFARLMGNFLVDGMGFSRQWRLLDLWNVMYVVGSRCLGVTAELSRPESRASGMPSPPRLQPDLTYALLVLGLVVLVSLFFLHRRIRAVEVVH